MGNRFILTCLQVKNHLLLFRLLSYVLVCFLHLKAHLWLGIKGKINVHTEVGWFTSTYRDSFLLI